MVSFKFILTQFIDKNSKCTYIVKLNWVCFPSHILIALSFNQRIICKRFVDHGLFSNLSGFLQSYHGKVQVIKKIRMGEILSTKRTYENYRNWSFFISSLYAVFLCSILINLFWKIEYLCSIGWCFCSLTYV